MDRREDTNFAFCGVYPGEDDDLSSFKGHRNTQSSLRERLTNISDKIIVKTKKINYIKATTTHSDLKKSKLTKCPNYIGGKGDV